MHLSSSHDQDAKPAKPKGVCGLPIIPAKALWKEWWDWLIIILVLYNTVLIPIEMAFDIGQVVGLEVCGYIIDVFFVVDLIFSFHHGLQDKMGSPINDKQIIAKKYLKSWFVVDFVAVIPLEMIITASGDLSPTQIKLAGLLKAPRLLRIGRLLKRFDKMSAAGVFRIFRLLFGFILIAHFLGCIWWGIGELEDDVSAWIYSFEVGEFDSAGNFSMVKLGYSKSILTQYFTSVYWALTTMTTVGYGDIFPLTVTEKIYAMFVFMVGALLNAFVFGNVAVLMQRFDETSRRYQEKIQGIRQMLKFYQVNKTDKDLAHMVEENFSFFWNVSGGFEFNDIMNSLPKSLQSDVALSMNGKVLGKTEVFRGCDKSLLRELALHMTVVVALPGQFIFKAGELGRHLYIVHSGTLQLLSADLSTVFTVYSAGSMCGESVLFGDENSQFHKLNVKATSHCQLSSLKKDTCLEVLLLFPRELAKIRTQVMRLQETLNRNMKLQELGFFAIGDGTGGPKFAMIQQQNVNRIGRKKGGANAPAIGAVGGAFGGSLATANPLDMFDMDSICECAERMTRLEQKLNATKKTVSQLASMVTALVEATANADYDREAIAKHLDFSLDTQQNYQRHYTERTIRSIEEEKRIRAQQKWKARKEKASSPLDLLFASEEAAIQAREEFDSQEDSDPSSSLEGLAGIAEEEEEEEENEGN